MCVCGHMHMIAERRVLGHVHERVNGRAYVHVYERVYKHVCRHVCTYSRAVETHDCARCMHLCLHAHKNTCHILMRIHVHTYVYALVCHICIYHVHAVDMPRQYICA